MGETPKKRRTKSAKQIEAELAKAKEKQKALQRELSDQRKAEAKKTKSHRTNAGMQVAGFIWKTLGLEWDCFDMEKFEQQFAAIAAKSYSDGTPVFNCAGEELDSSAARKYWQDHAKSKRTAAFEARAEKAAASTAEVGKKEWVCPECGTVGTSPENYYYKVCSCGHRITL